MASSFVVGNSELVDANTRQDATQKLENASRESYVRFLSFSLSLFVDLFSDESIA